MSYFIITSGEDGIMVRGPLDDDGVIEAIQPDEGGCAQIGSNIKFVGTVPAIDDGYFIGYGDSNVAVIIRGEVVVPKAVSVVEKYEL